MPSTPRGLQPYPQQAELPQRAGDSWKIEELALAEGAVIVVNWHLAHAEAALLDARHHLDSDTTAIALKRKTLQDVAAEESEIAVHVAQVQAEPEAHEVVVDTSDDLA